MIPLLPCPFCGGTAYLLEDEEEHMAQCSNCGCDLGWFPNEEEATLAWNTRVDTQPQQKLEQEIIMCQYCTAPNPEFSATVRYDAPPYDGGRRSADIPFRYCPYCGRSMMEPDVGITHGFEILNADGTPIDYQALGEKYKDQLVYCDLDGFYIGEDGALILLDDCGNSVTVDRQEYKIIPSGGSQWVSMEDRLPYRFEDVLIWDGDDYFTGYWREDAQSWDNTSTGWVHRIWANGELEPVRATHWMPLPQPPKGTNNEAQTNRDHRGLLH